jgi:hypothetical protein
MRKKSIAHKEKNGEKRKRGRPPKNKTAPVIQEELRAIPAAPDKTLKAINRDAPETSYFILCNGKPVKNIKELADVMEEIEDQVFNHHVNTEKNDFAKWVKDIFNDIELAEKLAGVKEKKHMQLVLYKHITHKLW